jgi:hypothetical protein
VTSAPGLQQAEVVWSSESVNTADRPQPTVQLCRDGDECDVSIMGKPLSMGTSVQTQGSFRAHSPWLNRSRRRGVPARFRAFLSGWRCCIATQCPTSIDRSCRRGRERKIVLRIVLTRNLGAFRWYFGTQGRGRCVLVVWRRCSLGGQSVQQAPGNPDMPDACADPGDGCVGAVDARDFPWTASPTPSPRSSAHGGTEPCPNTRVKLERSLPL